MQLSCAEVLLDGLQICWSSALGASHQITEGSYKMSGKIPLRAVKQWHRLSGKVVESLTLEVFKSCVAVALRDVVSGHGGNTLV